MGYARLFEFRQGLSGVHIRSGPFLTRLCQHATITQPSPTPPSAHAKRWCNDHRRRKFPFTPSRQLSPSVSPSVGYPSSLQRALSRTSRLSICGWLARTASIKCVLTASPKTEYRLPTLPAYFPGTMRSRWWYAPWLSEARCSVSLT